MAKRSAAALSGCTTAAVAAECARAANAVSLEAARAALVKKAKSTSGYQYLRCGGGENSTLMAARLRSMRRLCHSMA